MTVNYFICSDNIHENRNDSNNTTAFLHPKKVSTTKKILNERIKKHFEI